MTDTLYNWSETAATNDASDATINWVENQDPNTVNNSARAMMARLRQLINDIGPTKTSTGTSNAYAVTSNAAGAAYVNGEVVSFIVDRANTGAATLNVDARGALPWRPGIGLAFNSGDLIAGQPVTAFYNSAAACWYSTGTGYHVSSLSSGISLQSITARMPQIGDMVISLDATVGAGRIRLVEATQSVLKSAYPELDSWLSARTYPWGSTATHFSLPPAAGYFLRFAPTTTAIDPSGSRLAGVTQLDAVKSHTHAATGLTFTGTLVPDHTHPFTDDTSNNNNQGVASGGAAANSGLRTDGDNTGGGGAHTPAGTIGGATATNSADAETRPKNIAFHIDIIASTALSAAQVAVFGFPYKWDTGVTAADPGAGRVRGNNAALASITALYINNSDQWAVSLATMFATFATGSVLTFSKVGAQANRLTITLTGAPVAGTGFYTFPCSITTAAGNFSSNDNLALDAIGGVLGATGPVGPTGAQGVGGTDPGVRWNFDSSIVMADPGTGDIRFNNATLLSASAIAISDFCGETGNPDLSTFVLSWDDSTNTTYYGTIIIKKATAPQNVVVFKITGATGDNAGWSQLIVVAESASGSFTNGDALSVQFSRAGNKGIDGGGAGDVVGPAASIDSELAIYNSTTGKSIKRATFTGLVKATAGVATAAVEGTDYYGVGGTDALVTDGGTGRSTGTTAYALVATGITATGVQQTLANGATTEILVGAGPSALPVWTAASGSGSPVRATSPTLTSPTLTSPTLTSPILGEATVTSLNGGPLAGMRNLIINGGMAINQRAVATNADDTFSLDRWNILTQTAAIAVTQLADAENTTPHMLRMTQTQAAAQRFGVEQLIESINAKPFRGQAVTLSARVRCSNTTTLRYAIIEWTGAADVLTSDFVLDWTSPTFTAGNFFTTTTTTVTATGSIALTLNTFANISLTATLGNSLTNLAVIFWTDSTQAQNSTLDISKVQLENGSTVTPFERRSAALEAMACFRYYWLAGSLAGGWGATSTVATIAASLPVEMAVAPLLVLVNGSVAGGSALEISTAQRSVSSLTGTMTKTGGRFDATTAAAGLNKPCIFEAGAVAFNGEL